MPEGLHARRLVGELRGVDGEGAVEAEPRDSPREAVGPRVVGEVDRRVVGDAGEDLPVLDEPPVVVVEDDENYAAAEAVGRDVEREDCVVEGVEYVARVSAGREEDGGDVMADVARVRSVLRGSGPESKLGNPVHDDPFPFSRVRSNLFFCAAVAIDRHVTRRIKDNRRSVRMRSNVP